MDKNYYDNNAKQFVETTKDLDLSEIYRFFLPYLPKGGRILDAGCGSGRDTRAFLSQGYDVEAFDASAEMVKNASDLSGINVQQAQFDTFKSSKKFDGIWACASMLHIERAEFEQTFLSLMKHLKVGGVLYASFKYGEDEVVKGGRYFNNMTEKTFSDFIAPLKQFDLVDVKLTGDQRADRAADKWLNIILRRRATDPKTLTCTKKNRKKKGPTLSL